MSNRPVRNRQVKVRIRSTASSKPGGERLLVGLVGCVFGVLFSCCLGVGVLSLLDTAPEVRPVTPPPTEYDIEAIVEESYINGLLAEGTAKSQVPEFLAAGRVDVRSGGFIDFAVQLAVGPLRPLLQGTVALHVTTAGQVEVKLHELEAGRLSLAPLVPDRLLAFANDQINERLIERTTALGVRLLGITSDETTLHVYLVSRR